MVTFCTPAVSDFNTCNHFVCYAEVSEKFVITQYLDVGWRYNAVISDQIVTCERILGINVLYFVESWHWFGNQSGICEISVCQNTELAFVIQKAINSTTVSNQVINMQALVFGAEAVIVLSIKYRLEV